MRHLKLPWRDRLFILGLFVVVVGLLVLVAWFLVAIPEDADDSQPSKAATTLRYQPLADGS